ncbi:hypothetical protein PABG_03308 [Paracoccidioides brasiliensis Pb03]|nr:hypothetical protein PABG_03308 [Paracoccidioides brasiliensis Pb03]
MASYYENHPYNTQRRRAHTADFYESSHASPRPTNNRWGPNTDLVRPDDTEDSKVEEIQRDFPPGSSTAGYRPDNSHGAMYERRAVHEPSVRRTNSLGGRGRDRRRNYYTEDEYHRRSHRQGDESTRRARDRDHHSRRPYSGASSRTPSPRPRRRKSFSEQALAAIGLGSVTGSHASRRHDGDRGSYRDHYDRDYDRSRSHHRRQPYSYYSRSHSLDRNDNQKDITQALKAALTAGAAEAIRARKEPGGWSGEKGKRILTAAIGAGGVNKLLDGQSDKHSKRHLIESTLAGLATNRLVNGPRSRSRGRARSESRGAKDIASAGLLAAAGKSAYDHFRLKSRGREARSGYSSDSEGSPGLSRRSRGSKERSQSVSAYLAKGLVALGLGDEQSSSHGNRHRERRRYDGGTDSDDGYSDVHRSRHRHNHSRDSYSRDVGRLRPTFSSPSFRETGAMMPVAGGTGTSSALPKHYPHPRSSPQAFHHRHSTSYGGDNTDSDFSSLSTDTEERTRKKLLRREVLTTGLATIATVHAGHGVVKSLKKRKERIAQLRDGEISADEARRQRAKNNMKDAASIALAAIGIKGVVDEWKDAANHHAEKNSFKANLKYRREMREMRERGMERQRRARSWSPDDRYERRP